jgi:hypothetical protein
MTSHQFLVCDNSTLANFKGWASAISAFFATAGWTQSSDTGQVNWSTISTVPGSSAYVYEVWEPNDGLTNFYLKVEYGNQSSTNCPTVRLTISTGTNGAGTMTGYVLGPYNTNTTSYTAPSPSTTYECDFSGAAGRIGTMLWRNGINSCQQFFGVERSLNSSGAYTGTHVTLLTAGNSSNATGTQQSLVFGVGVAPAVASVGTSWTGWACRSACATAPGAAAAFNGAIPMDTVAPAVGFFDFPLTAAGLGMINDFAEGVTFVVTLYGSTRTFMPSKNGPFSSMFIGHNGGSALCMRYD